jgi:TRAP-type C4-dicarboxylate transport system substrate-binding protein
MHSSDMMSDLMARTELRVGGYAPIGSVHSLALEHFRDFMHDQSNGSVHVDILYNIMDLDQPVGALIDMAGAGELDLTYMSASYFGDDVSEMNALEIPYLFPTLSDAHRALDGELGRALTDAVSRKINLSVLGFWDNGFRHLTNSVRPIRSPADCEGLTIRLQPNQIHEALARSWGMTPITAELSEGIAMITSGAVNAQENPLANSVAYGVPHTHITMSAHLYGARAVLAGPDWQDRFDAKTATMIRDGARSAIEFQRGAAEAYEAVLRKNLEDEGRQFVDLSPEENEAFRSAASDVIADAYAELPSELRAALPKT